MVRVSENSVSSSGPAPGVLLPEKTSVTGAWDGVVIEFWLRKYLAGSCMVHLHRLCVQDCLLCYYNPI